MSYKGETLTTRLRHARESAGLSQRALSTTSGLSQSHISLIERGALEPGLASLVDIARALDLELVLVPRKLLPAVQAMIGTSLRPDGQAIASGKAAVAIARAERFLKKQRALYGGSADLDKIQETLRLLYSTPLDAGDLTAVHETLQPLYHSQTSKQSHERARAAAERLQALRNRVVHRLQSSPRPAYSLDDGDDA